MFVYQRVPLGCAQVQRGTRQTCSIFVGEDVKTQASPRDWTGQCQLQFMRNGLFCDSGLIWETWVCLRWFFIFPMENPPFGESIVNNFLLFGTPYANPRKDCEDSLLRIRIANNECDIWPANMWVSEMVVMYPTILGDSTCNHRVGMGRNLLCLFFVERKSICQLLWYSAGV